MADAGIITSAADLSAVKRRENKEEYSMDCTNVFCLIEQKKQYNKLCNGDGGG